MTCICGQIIFWMILAILHSNYTRNTHLLPLGSITTAENEKESKTAKAQPMSLHINYWDSWQRERTKRYTCKSKSWHVSIKCHSPEGLWLNICAINNKFGSNWWSTILPFYLPCSDQLTFLQARGWECMVRSRQVSNQMESSACSPSSFPAPSQQAYRPKRGGDNGAA